MKREKHKRRAAVSMTLEEADAALAIDLSDVDTELQRHAEIQSHISKQVVIAADRRDRAKDAMEEREAVLYSKLRKDATKGMTDHAVRQAVRKDSTMIESIEEYRDAKLEAALWEAAEKAFIQRGFMLKSLSDKETARIYNLGQDSSSYKRRSYERPDIRNRRRDRGD